MELEIMEATSADSERVYKFLCSYFYADEPMNVALKKDPPATLEECLPIHFLKENLSLLAVQKDNPDIICGLCINKEERRNEKSKAFLKAKEDNKETKYGKIISLLEYNRSKCRQPMEKYWEEAKTERALHLMILAVRSDCRQQNIAGQLLDKTFELARENEYRLLTIECSSAFSAKLVIKAGFDVLYQLPFKDYKDEKGNTLINTEAPHLILRTCVKMLDN